MNRDIFSEKVIAYKDTIYRIAYSYCKNASDADDISQDVFMKFYFNKHSFETDGEEKAWLIRVTINACKNLHKSKWKSSREELNENTIITSSINNEKNDIVNAVFSLPEKYRIVIHLFYFEDYTIKDISNATGRKQSTIQTQLQRAREMLKKQLGEEYIYE